MKTNEISPIITNHTNGKTNSKNTKVKFVQNSSNPIKSNLSGVQVLASYNSPIVFRGKEPKWMLDKKTLNEIKDEYLIFFDECPDDKTISYAVYVLCNSKHPNDKDLSGIGVIIEKINSFSDEEKEKIFNSGFLKLAFDLNSSQASRYTALNIPPKHFEKLDKLIKNPLNKTFLEKYIKAEAKKQIAGLDYAKMLKNINEAVESVDNFTHLEHSSKFYNLLIERSYEDIYALTNILSKRIKGKTEQEVEELYPLIEFLLSAKTPSGEFVFSQSRASDNSKKMLMDGIENILDSKDEDPKRFNELINLTKLITKGQLPPHIMGILPAKGKINEEFQEILKSLNQNQVSEFKNKKEALLNLKPGGTCEIEGKLFYRNNSGLIPLKLSKETFEKLFPIIPTFAMAQGELGDCYLVSAIFDFIKNPDTKGKIFQMFDENKDEIIITIPDTKEYPSKYSKELLESENEKAINASLGIQMLENAYMHSRSHKYQTADKINSIEGGCQGISYNALLGENKAKIFLTTENDLHTPEDILKAMDEVSDLLEKAKTQYKGLKYNQDAALFDKINYLTDQELAQNIKELEAAQRNLKEELEYMGTRYSVTQDELLEKVINNANDKNCLVSAGSKPGNDYFDKDKLIHASHAYSILGTDNENHIIKIVNPWNCTAYSEISFDEFKNYFDLVSVVHV